MKTKVAVAAVLAALSTPSVGLAQSMPQDTVILADRLFDSRTGVMLSNPVVVVRADRIVSVQGRNGPGNEQRLCVKGRFGFDYVSHPHRLSVPLIRRDDAPKHADAQVDPANPFTHFREGSPN